MPTFGARLKASMLAAGITSPEQLADRMKVSPQVVRRWQKLKEPELSATNLLNLAEVLQVRVFWLGRGGGPIHRFVAAEIRPEELEKKFSMFDRKDKIFLRDMMEVLIRYRDD